MKLKYIVLSVTSSILLLSNTAFALTADDVVCVRCVGTTDINAGAVTGGRIANNAVNSAKIRDGSINSIDIKDGAITTSKISNASIGAAKIKDGVITNIKLKDNAVSTTKIKAGSVTEAKLSAAVQSKLNSVGGGLPTYNRPIVTATQRVYNLAGDFLASGPAVCQSAGSDTEVQDITRTTVTGGILIEITRTRFNGGTSGTKCHHQVFTFFNNGTETTLVKREKWNSAGTTLNQTNEFLDFNAVDCSDCGMIVREDDMSQGLLLASGGILTSTDGSSTVINEELAISLISLQEVNQSETVNEGELNEQTFTGCMSYLEDRTSSNIGSFKTYRVMCPTVGRIQEFRRRTDGRSQMWELTSFVAP